MSLILPAACECEPHFPVAVPCCVCVLSLFKLHQQLSYTLYMLVHPCCVDSCMCSCTCYSLHVQCGHMLCTHMAGASRGWGGGVAVVEASTAVLRRALHQQAHGLPQACACSEGRVVVAAAVGC